MKKLLFVFLSLVCTQIFAEEKNETEKITAIGQFVEKKFGTLFIDESGAEYMVLKNSLDKVKAHLNTEVEVVIKVKPGTNRKRIIFVGQIIERSELKYI